MVPGNAIKTQSPEEREGVVASSAVKLRLALFIVVPSFFSSDSISYMIMLMHGLQTGMRI